MSARLNPKRPRNRIRLDQNLAGEIAPRRLFRGSWSDHVCLELHARGKLDHLFTLARLDTGILRVKSAPVLRPANIGDAHPRDHSAIDFIRRKTARTTQHYARQTGL